MQRMTERHRCQHANLSELWSHSPTHTFSVKHRKSFSTTRIYAGDKANLLLRSISDSQNCKAGARDTSKKRMDGRIPHL
jgi:hypothetical protein